ncbi:4Fe-4S ferredoxin iron-sulfur binding domain-containing protein [Spirochaeta thermophila DSM 6578]|uniref:4Fe-4S ferredoxin iron-sulfur binding domain-containing protein n=1 Tax=Winmispira thermophila (strain ATCC 700085 / DSM 6578 / Z-1203) TaxID=869211 RepID=G0GE93_WINT7|nr:4Fe-4S ferredoxin iron-sulfur binding domain-containing protein [Spirochaeta thermophila DSM 6578]
MAAQWYPIIDPDRCTNCNTCVDFCPHDVFQEGPDHPLVAHPENCVEFCRGCQKACPNEAITYFGDTNQ